MINPRKSSAKITDAQLAPSKPLLIVTKQKLTAALATVIFFYRNDLIIIMFAIRQCAVRMKQKMKTR